MGQDYAVPHVGEETLKVYGTDLHITTRGGWNNEGVCTLPQVREETLTVYGKDLHVTTRGGNKTDYMGKYFKYILSSCYG